ncbi:sigma 54-interacting transcriptional regulator [Bacillus sp. PK3_68]|uniref:sigma 54-interacting transcriptional regulator n=1 Tax=Bacillus sp. PK3_68 TaxID=2027408 RepID=UPI00217D4DCA|nr:sigma 54-interacting transcriptional regulator [Bacillus sp. PK3_68]
MFSWKEILRPVPFILTSQATVQDVLYHITKNSAELVLIEENGKVVGYVDKDLLLQQIQRFSHLQRPVEYRHDILKVPLNHEIEFYHNISVYVGVNESEELVGYSTIQHVRQQIHEFSYKHLKQLNAGAGIGIVTTNQSLEITFVNEMAEEILGLSSCLLLGRNYSSLIEVEHSLKDVLAGKSLVSVNSYFNSKQLIGNFTRMDGNGQMTGLVHIFFLREQWEEAVRELEFVRDLNEDMQAIYSSSQEQILVVNPQGTILRLAGTFLKDFWGEESPDKVIGCNILDLESQGLFQPNIIGTCLKKEKKLTSIHEGRNGRRLWTVATPVFHEGKITKIIVISRDITEVNELREKLIKVQQESEGYKQELNQLKSRSNRKSGLVYQSQEMALLVDQIRKVTDVDSTILIQGESGVGKEVIALAVHEWSQRNSHPFVRVNCGAIPEQLIESELFGYEKGAFTGADPKGRAGYFERANQGSIFLDEVSELPLNMQVKLLRVIQEREVTRVGGTKTISLDTRIIAATNKDLWELVQAGKFREDLYYRLHVIPIRIPPLRERKEDIIPLSLYFLKHFNHLYNKDKSLSTEALEIFESHQWLGNVRELQNMIERLVVTSQDDFIHADDVLLVLYNDQKK